MAAKLAPVFSWPVVMLRNAFGIGALEISTGCGENPIPGK
jgi:hypothetical protein